MPAAHVTLQLVPVAPSLILPSLSVKCTYGVQCKSMLSVACSSPKRAHGACIEPGPTSLHVLWHYCLDVSGSRACIVPDRSRPCNCLSQNKSISFDAFFWLHACTTSSTNTNSVRGMSDATDGQEESHPSSNVPISPKPPSL